MHVKDYKRKYHSSSSLDSSWNYIKKKIKFGTNRILIQRKDLTLFMTA